MSITSIVDSLTGNKQPTGTNPTINAFVAKWGGAAAAAGAALHIPTSYVLAQWGMESNWGRSLAGQNNLAGIKCTNGDCSGAYQNFSKPQDFVSEYVKSVSSDFEGLKTQPNVSPSHPLTIQGIFGQYVPGSAYASIPASSYASRVQNFYNELTHNSGQLSTIKPSFNVPSVNNVGPFNNAFTGFFSGLSNLYSPIEMFFMSLVGLGLIIGGMLLVLKSDETRVRKEVKKNA